MLSLRAPGIWPQGRPDQLELRWQEQADGTPIHLHCHPPGTQEPPHSLSWSLQIPLEQLLLAAERRQLTGCLAMDGMDSLDGTSPASAGLRAAIRRLRAIADQGLSQEWLVLEPQLLDLLVDALMAAPGGPMPRQDRGWRHVIETLGAMDRWLGEELSLADLSMATGVSPRSLQMAFRRHLQKRPLQSLRELRLARLRQLLLRAGRRPGMAEALGQCGLPGNGTTARHYQDRFAEKPSQTRS
jgi:AraC-like DNA-binding protein